MLTGILPTIRKGDLSHRQHGARTRATWLSTTRCTSLRGEAYELHIKGIDELRVRQDSVMAEACNASFQVHLQVSAGRVRQHVQHLPATGRARPRVATNSPLLFGKRLWAETRIALFEQSVDTRRPGHHMRDRSARVTFGTDWVHESIAELYKEDITRFRPLLAPDAHDDPIAELAAGGCRSLAALRMHTGTVWRWNRGCYGISDPTACRISASRTGCCRQGRASPTRSPMPPCGSD